VEPLFARASSITVDDGLEFIAKLLVFHHAIVEFFVFDVMSIEFGLETFNVLGNVSHVVESL
jgi:hypothetical protein